MEYLSVPSSSKLVGIALATTVGAEDITVAITKTLLAKGMGNVVVSFVEDPAILPFIAKSLSETCHVVLAVAVLNGDAKNMAQFLTKALTETGLETGCPVVPGLMSPASYLEMKALLPGCACQWANSVSSILAVKGGVQPVAVTDIVHESVLAAAALPPIVITPETTNLDHLLGDLRESFKSHGARGICGIARSFRIMDDNNSKTLDISEFTKGITEHTLGWSPAQVKQIFDCFDTEKNGQISYDEFLVQIRGPMNTRRQQMCLLAFEVLQLIQHKPLLECNSTTVTTTISDKPPAYIRSSTRTNQESSRWKTSQLLTTPRSTPMFLLARRPSKTS
jgi:calcyphosin